MLIEVKEKWLHDGELCIRGTADGEPFSALFINTEVDYGWNALNYLSAYRSEPDLPDLPNEQDGYLVDVLWEELDAHSLLIDLLKAQSS